MGEIVKPNVASQRVYLTKRTIKKIFGDKKMNILKIVKSFALGALILFSPSVVSAQYFPQRAPYSQFRGYNYNYGVRPYYPRHHNYGYYPSYRPYYPNYGIYNGYGNFGSSYYNGYGTYFNPLPVPYVPPLTGFSFGFSY